MKKILTSIITAGSIASFALAPVAALATIETPEIHLRANANVGMQKSNTSAGASVRAGLDFCDFIAEKSVDDFKQWDARMGMAAEHREKRDDFWAAFRAKSDTRIDDKRDDRQDHWNDLIAKWESRADTDAERMALTQFKTELHAAIADRQASVDATVDASRDDRDEVRVEARAEMDAAMAELKDDVSAALDRAQDKCNDGTASATVRTQFSADVKAATDEFKTKVADIKVNLKADAEGVRDERKDAMMESRTEFRGFWDMLRARFQALFGVRAKGDVEVR